MPRLFKPGKINFDPQDFKDFKIEWSDLSSNLNFDIFKPEELFETNDPDVFKTFKEIVVDNGYEYEEHRVSTQDGYVLTLFRIPGREGESGEGKSAVLMQHGLMDSADAWIANRREKAPALVLVEAGYDVWLGNSRGNKYSRGHVDSKISDKDYWAFSFQQMGDHDVPTAIDYIRKVTK